MIGNREQVLMDAMLKSHCGFRALIYEACRFIVVLLFYVVLQSGILTFYLISVLLLLCLYVGCLGDGLTVT
jgi:uncharacterized membrane protein YobD (UPF0266 family)